MKTHKLISTFVIAAFALTPQFTSSIRAAGNGYSAKLISPRLGQVLYPGQHVRIQWEATFPDLKNVHLCEMEIWLSLDGGRTFTHCITPVINPQVNYYDWIVPDTPTNAAVLDIRFGCELYYPESYSPQPQATFVIARSAPVPVPL